MNDVKPKRVYRSKRRKQQAEATRDMVLDAADHLFRKGGWGATTITAIAHAAGVSTETIYAHFGNKRTIAHQLVIRATRGDQPKVPMMQQERRSKVLQMTDGAEIIDAFAADLCALLARGAPILAIVRAAAETDAEMAALYADLHKSRRRNLATVIDALERIGALRPDLDPEDAKDTLWSIVSPELWLLRTRQLSVTPAANLAWLRTTLKRLLLP